MKTILLRKALILFTAFTLGLGMSSSSCDKIGDIVQNVPLSDAEIAKGLREALLVSTDTSVKNTHKQDGFFKNALIKIGLPPEAAKVENTLRDIGLGTAVDELILKLNRAAEDAAGEAKPIFVNAIRDISIANARDILFGTDTAATAYLRVKTSADLMAAFSPKVKASLDKVGATAAWNYVFTNYNKIPLVTPVNPNLDQYATSKALHGLFVMVGQEEKGIRKNVTDRVNETLRKVFGELDK